MFPTFEFSIDAIEHIVAIEKVSALGGLPALLDPRPDLIVVIGEDAVTLFEKPHRFGNHFARRLIEWPCNFQLRSA